MKLDKHIAALEGLVAFSESAAKRVHWESDRERLRFDRTIQLSKELAHGLRVATAVPKGKGGAQRV